MENTLVENIIETYIQQSEREAERRAGEDAKKLKVALHDLSLKIESALGEAWPALEPFIVKHEYDRQGNNFYFSVHVQPDALQLAPFCIETGTDRDVVLSRHNALCSWHDKIPLDKLGLFLAERRKAYPEWRKDYIEDQTKPWWQKLFNASLTIEQADEVWVKLLEIDPEHKEQWDAKRADWQQRYDSRLEYERNEERVKLERERAAGEYDRAYRAFLENYRSVLLANRAKVADLQMKLAQPYDVWTLTYAIIARDEFEGYIKTRDVDVLDDHVDEYNRWRTLNSGRIEEMVFFHPVKLAGPILVDPVNTLNLPDCIGHFWIACAQTYLRFNPAQGPRGIEEIDFENLPDRPSIPDCLDDVVNIVRQAHQEFSEKNPDFDDWPE